MKPGARSKPSFGAPKSQPGKPISARATLEQIRAQGPAKREHRRCTQQRFRDIKQARNREAARHGRRQAWAVSRIIDDVLDIEEGKDSATRAKERQRQERIARRDKHIVTAREYVRIRNRWESKAGHLGRAYVLGKVVDEVWEASERELTEEEQRKKNRGRKPRKHWHGRKTDWDRATEAQVHMLREESERARARDGELAAALRVLTRYAAPQIVADFDLSEDRIAAVREHLAVEIGYVLEAPNVRGSRVLLEFDGRERAEAFYEWMSRQGVPARLQPGFYDWLQASAE